MRKIVGSILVVLAAACQTAPAPVGAPGEAAGAVTATLAVNRFLAAAQRTDVQTMAALFGTADGSIAGRTPQTEVEKRMRALACYLNHDGARVLEDVPGVGQGRAVTVELTQRELTRRPRFTVVTGPRNRWFVESFDINTVADFCRPVR